MKQCLIGKKVLITGASGGIGRATAIMMAKEGADVALIGRNRVKLDSISVEIGELGRKAPVFEADVTDADAVNRTVKDTIEYLGGLDILFCNAGVYLRCPTKELTLGEIRRVMEVNYFGTLNAVYAVLPYFIEKKSGSIIATCSMDGKKGVPPDAAYVGSKFAMNGFFQVLRQEMKEYGIHCGIICPARVDTEMIKDVECPKITPKFSPDLVAKAVIRSYLKKKKEILVPYFSCHLLTWADALSPTLGDFLVKVNKLGGTDTKN
ncbi:MAG: SDR family oxidoreductase [Clostridia bacterium]|nr:SDR family oxidoreductase [Clostridia bacterium]